MDILEWWAVFKISVPVLLLDELLKYVARNFVEGNKMDLFCSGARPKAPTKPWREATYLLLAWISYFALLYYTSSELTKILAQPFFAKSAKLGFSN